MTEDVEARAAEVRERMEARTAERRERAAQIAADAAERLDLASANQAIWSLDSPEAREAAREAMVERLGGLPPEEPEDDISIEEAVRRDAAEQSRDHLRGRRHDFDQRHRQIERDVRSTEQERGIGREL